MAAGGWRSLFTSSLIPTRSCVVEGSGAAVLCSPSEAVPPLPVEPQAENGEKNTGYSYKCCGFTCGQNMSIYKQPRIPPHRIP